MVRLRRSRGLRCQEVVELVTEYLEVTLTPDVRARLELHLQACRNCAAYLEQVQAMVRALGRLAAPALDPQATADLLREYRRWTAA